MVRALKITGKVLLIAVASVIALFLLAILVLNLAKFAIYSEYYSIEDNLCKNPGLNDGFICQGICINEETKQVLVSGYMDDGSASRIYVTDLDDNSYYLTLSSEGKPFTKHCGGISLNGDVVYIATGRKLYTFSLRSVLEAKNGDEIDIGEGISVNNKASFCFADENYVYVGEFFDRSEHEIEHTFDTPDGKCHTIVSRYTHADLTKPDKVYAIRDKIQGICFTPDGKVVLSDSYGINDSHYYVYTDADAVDTGETFDGAPLYYLSNCENVIKGPSMAEGLDIYEGKVITLTESASTKYIFGKFFFANKIVSLDIK